MTLLHQNKIVHCDIKADNIMILMYNNTVVTDVRIVDFGAMNIQKEGTRKYTIEMFTYIFEYKTSYTFNELIQHDRYCMGLTIWRLLSTDRQFEDMYMNMMKYGRLIIEKDIDIRFTQLNIFQQLNLLFQYYLNIDEKLFNETSSYIEKFHNNKSDKRSHSNLENFKKYYFRMFPKMTKYNIDNLFQSNQLIPKNIRNKNWRFITVKNPMVISLKN